MSYAPPTPRMPSRRALRPPRVLYFDIDGTLVQPTFGAAKPALADGRFEQLVKGAGFDRFVCVSDGVLMARALEERGCGDTYANLFRYCAGTIADEAWFRSTVELVSDPLTRGSAIDRTSDWYYVDDFASVHLRRAWGRAQAVRAAVSDRVLLCAREGSGEDVVRWLESLASRPSGVALQQAS